MTGLRVGFVADPEALVPVIEHAIRLTTWNTPAVTTAIAKARKTVDADAYS